MRCAKARDLFSSYLENEMDVPTSVQFEKHLAECNKCHADYDRFTAAVMVLDEVKEVDPPAGLHAAVMAGVEKTRRTVPSPVRWWQIDWQHVFTLRVPARAAAFAAVALVMVALLVQTTPVGTGVMNLFGLQKASPTSIGDDLATTPSWQLPSPDNAYDTGESGLLIGVTSGVGTGDRVYAIRLQSKGEEPIRFQVSAAGRTYSGWVMSDQDTTIRVSVDAPRDLVVAKVKWTYEGKDFSQYVFLPHKFNVAAHSERLSFTFEQTTARDILETVAKTYGVVVITSGDLTRKITYAEVESGSPAEALFHGVEETNANMKQKILAPSIYVVEPAK